MPRKAKQNPVDLAIEQLDKEIEVLQEVRGRLLAAVATPAPLPVTDAPKTKRGRKPKDAQTPLGGL